MIVHPGIAALVHAAFEFAGIGLGVALYRRHCVSSGQGGLTQPGNFAVTVGLLVGAMLGNKLVFLVERPQIIARWLAADWALPGQSIVGGLLGGLLGVECAKVLSGRGGSIGDPLVWPIAVGLAYGRIGCFVAGLHDDTYGLPTHLPWGVDFGDGIARHPTQLYDLLVVLLLAWCVDGRYPEVPGLAFKLFLSAYLLWRLLIDGCKPVPFHYPFGWSGIQWVCLIALVLYVPLVMRAWRHLSERRSGRE